MFTEKQLIHYRTFGFVMMRGVFTPEEMKTMQEEFEMAVRRQDEIAPYDGKAAYRHTSVLGDDTPFFASLTEDERLYRSAQQIFGDDVILQEWHIYQYFARTGTFWHANDGDPTHGRYIYGARYQFPVFEPVRADSGALRVIPGSHQAEFQWEVRKADAAGLLADIDQVGCVVCEAEPGDVVAFDTRVYHATAPYQEERRVASGIYAHFPETPEETAATGEVLGGGGKQWEEWRQNKTNSSFRRRREELMERLREAKGKCGYRVERQPDGVGGLVRS